MKVERYFIALLFVLAITIYLPGLGQVPFPLSSNYSDFSITHLPNAIFLREEILNNGEIPLWSPLILSGYPFSANPLSGLWYPPGWVNFLLPIPWGMNLSVVLHLIWLGFGMYLFLRQLNLGIFSASLGGVFVMLLPKLAAHFGAGHLTLIYAFSWTPWLLWVERIKGKSNQEKLLFPGLIMGVIFLADPRWVFPAGVLWFGWRLLDAKTSTFPALIKAEAWNFLLQVLIAIGISAPLLFSLIEYTLLSSRVGMTGEDSSVLALPAGYLFGLIAPPFEINAEWFAYFGIVPLLMAIWGWGNNKSRKQQWFWLVAFICGLILSVLPGIPGLEWVGKVAGLGLMRVPSRFLLISGFGLAILAANGVENSLSLPQKRIRLRIIGIFVLVLLLFAISLFSAGSKMGVSFLWTSGFGLSIFILLRITLKKKSSGWLISAIIISIAMLDVGGTGQIIVRFKTYENVISDNQEIAAYLAEQPGIFRVYSPSYSLPQQVAANSRLQLADGVDPLQLKRYVEFMLLATGVPGNRYSVTLPAFATALPELDNAGYTPDAIRLGWINVKYIVSEFDLFSPLLRLKNQIGQTRVYENKSWLPRVWIQDYGSALGVGIREVEELNLSPNRIVIKATGPGQLVLAEINYPGWRVKVDGVEQPIDTVAGVLRSVQLASGMHEVEWRYQPLSVNIGIGFFTITCCLLVMRKIVMNRRRNRHD